MGGFGSPLKTTHHCSHETDIYSGSIFGSGRCCFCTKGIPRIRIFSGVRSFSSEVWTRSLDSEVLTLKSGFRSLDSKVWISKYGFRSLDFEVWIPKSGFRSLDSEVWISKFDSEIWIRNNGLLTLHSQVWTRNLDSKSSSLFNSTGTKPAPRHLVHQLAGESTPQARSEIDGGKSLESFSLYAPRRTWERLVSPASA